VHSKGRVKALRLTSVDFGAMGFEKGELHSRRLGPDENSRT